MENKDNIEQINEYINEEQKINKKSNTFNLIIGLATLIIAILGASFAYFTMTSGSAENSIVVKSSYVSIRYDGGTKVEADDLIPTNENVMLWAYKERLGEFYQDAEGNEKSFQCIDSNNRKVCYVYQFAVSSDGEAGSTTDILGTISVNQNEFVEEFKNEEGEVTERKSGLSYMVFKLDTDEEGKTTYTKVSESAVSSINRKDIEKYGENNEEYKFQRFKLPLEETLDDGTTVTRSAENYLFGEDGHIEIENTPPDTVEEEQKWTIFQLVIWLHDDDYDQNKQQSKHFAGTIKVNVHSGDNMGVVTGTKDEEETPEEPTE